MRRKHATPADNNRAKTAAYQERNQVRGRCRLCPRRRAKGDPRFCRTHRERERERDRTRKRLIARRDRAHSGTAAIARARRDRRA